MITIAGFNSAIDKYAEVDALRIGETTRMRNLQALPGGKGVHVALAAAALGEPVRLVGCVDSANTRRFETFLERRGVEFHGIVIDGDLRTCLAIRDQEGRFTELLESGTELRHTQAGALTSSFLQCCDGTDMAVLSGSLPPGLAANTYGRLARTLAQRGLRSIIDTSGAALREAVASGVFAIKPNSLEIAALIGRPVDSVPVAIDVVRQLSRRGIELVVVSAGQHGAVASWHGRTCHISAPTLSNIQNTVGAGDCLVAGLAVGLARRSPAEEVLRLAVACGSAKVVRAETGLVRREDIDRLLPLVEAYWSDEG